MSPPPLRRLIRPQQREATRAVLIETARKLFGARGYAAVSTTDIVEAAEVTRGALYHHFEDKRALFAAVYHAEEEAMLAKVAGAAMGAEGWARMVAVVGAYLDVCLDETARRVMFMDAPGVLGWGAWREHGGGSIQAMAGAMLSQAMEEGTLRPSDPEALAVLVLGAMNEAGLALAADPSARDRYEGVLLEVLGGLRAAESR